MPKKSTGLLGIVAAALVLASVSARPQPAAAQAASAPAGAATPTWSRDIAPILNTHCVSCHRPGEIAPMSLLTYADVRPWARAIDKAVAGGIMPPWHADAASGTFENERRLSAVEKTTIARWVDAGAPQGDPAAAPAAPAFADGWRIGKPHSVFEMLEDYPVPARGQIEYEYFYIPTDITETKWLQAIEVRPGNRTVVHHVLVYYVAPATGPNPPLVRGNPAHGRIPLRSDERGVSTHPVQRRPGQVRQLLATYAPGTEPQIFRPGTAVRLAPGGVIELQMHYTATGTAGTDRTKVGMVFASAPPRQEIRPTQFINAVFTIPAGAADHRVDTEAEFLDDAVLWGVFPHTHVRGKRWNYTLALPDGTTKPLLSVPDYDFNWQTYYMFKEPLQIPKGAKIIASAWYDNSAANRFNPDPKKDVGWGDQTWQEMQYTGLLYSAR